MLKAISFNALSPWGGMVRQTLSQVLQCQCRVCQTPLAETLETTALTENTDVSALAAPDLRKLAMICTPCALQLPWLKPTESCRHCLMQDTPLDESGRCSHCHMERWESVDGVFAPWRYAHPMSRLIVHAKNHPDLALANYAAVAMCLSTLRGNTCQNSSMPTLPFAARIPDWLPDIDAMVPMPLYPTRARWRGFNHAYTLAHAIAKGWRQTPERINLPVHSAWVEKIRDTSSQNQRNRAERFRSVKNAFAANAAVRGKNLIVVDDVMTSGATVLSLAHTLKNAGARRVYAMVMARAVFRSEAL